MNTRQKKSIGQNRTPTERPVANVVAAPEGVVGHYPLSSVFVAFGLGLAVGVALGASIGGPVAPRPSWGRRTELAAENLGRHMRDAIASVLPETLSKHIA